MHKKKLKTAYDLDGTLIVSPFENLSNTGNGIRGWLLRNMKKIVFRVNKRVKKEDVEIVLTARSRRIAWISWLLLRASGYKNIHTLICNPRDQYNREYLAEFKAEMIDKYGLEQYVDDDTYFSKLVMEKLGMGKCLFTTSEWVV